MCYTNSANLRWALRHCGVTTAATAGHGPRPTGAGGKGLGFRVRVSGLCHPGATATSAQRPSSLGAARSPGEAAAASARRLRPQHLVRLLRCDSILVRLDFGPAVPNKRNRRDRSVPGASPPHQAGCLHVHDLQTSFYSSCRPLVSLLSKPSGVPAGWHQLMPCRWESGRAVSVRTGLFRLGARREGTVSSCEREDRGERGEPVEQLGPVLRGGPGHSRGRHAVPEQQIGHLDPAGGTP